MNCCRFWQTFGKPTTAVFGFDELVVPRSDHLAEEGISA